MRNMMIRTMKRTMIVKKLNMDRRLFTYEIERIINVEISKD